MSRMPDTQVIALTGTMGSGKSTAARLLGKKIPVTDCDAINAALLEKDQPGYLALKKAGYPVFDENELIDKAKMAGLLFTDEKAKKEIEAILHPLILQKIHEWTARQKGICAVEVPILFESHLENEFDQIWCISASREISLQRLAKGRSISREEADRRLAFQFPIEVKESLSDEVIYNNGTPAELEAALDEKLQNLAFKINSVRNA